MKKSLKFVAASVLACLSLCMVAPKVAKAEYYKDLDYPGNPIFATDSYISPNGSWCEAISANFECVNDETQRVQVYSLIYYRDMKTGLSVSKPMEKSGEARGVGATKEGAYVEIYWSAPAGYRIYLINSIHNGYFMGQRITENTSYRR